MSDAAVSTDIPSTDIPSEVASDEAAAAAAVRVYVCTTCRDRVGNPGARPGARLYDALCAKAANKAADPRVTIVPVECLSVCKMSVAISFAAEGKWTYVYGVSSDADAATILEGARLYAEASEGLIAWGQRPDILKKGVIARIPPRPAAGR